jgi:predicted ATPase
LNERTIQTASEDNSSRRLPPFVGREAELRQLESAFEASAAGRGALILLAGEPGIGKTALCEQFSGYVSGRGGVALVGHCYRKARAAYQPFVEAFESYARECDPRALREELGPDAREVARMVPSLRSRLQFDVSGPEHPADDQLRLLSGVLDCLRSMGAAHPLLLVLEDLHDADRGALDLLVYLARHLARTQLMVIGTYRDVEVDRTHPLAASLAELRRVSQFERAHLGELSVSNVQRLLVASTHQAVPRPLAELVQNEDSLILTHASVLSLSGFRLRQAASDANLSRRASWAPIQRRAWCTHVVAFVPPRKICIG